jgi:MFS family permease
MERALGNPSLTTTTRPLEISGRAVLALAVSVQLVLFVSMAVISPVLDALVRQPFQLDNTGTSWFLKANGAATLVFALVAGWWSDRTGRRVAILSAALAGTAVLTAALPWINDYNLLLMIRFLQGCFDTTAQVVLLALVLDRAPHGKTGRWLGIVTGALPVAYLCGPLVASVAGPERLAELFGVIGLLLLLCAGAVILVQESSPAVTPAATTPQLDRELAKRLALPITFGMIDKFSFAGFALLTSLVVADRFGLESVRASGWLLAAFWGAFLIGLYPAIRIVERLGPWLPMGVASLLFGLSYLLLGVVNYPLMVALMGVCGWMSAAMHLPAIILAGRAGGHAHRGLAMGAFSFSGTLAMIIGFAVLGRVSDSAGYGAAYAVGGGLEVAAALALIGFLAVSGRLIYRKAATK